MTLRAILVALLVAFVPSAVRAGYVIENVPLPAELRGGVVAVAFTPGGSAVVATRLGEVWLRPAAEGAAWRRFAGGLDEPMGLIAESESVILAAHRPEVLRMTDRDGDGRADTFEAIGGRWGQSINYHEFLFGPARDAAGNLFVAPSLDSTTSSDAAQKAAYPGLPARGPRDFSFHGEVTGHNSETPWRGWIVRLGADGSFEPWASGFRQANGLAFSPGGELFATDNQGDYKASTGLLHIARGDFHGHAASLKWEAASNPENATPAALWRRLKTPAVVFPHGPMGTSPGPPVWDRTGGRFGPYTGQVFTGDYSRLVVRASLEQVAGTWQGACFPFLGRNEAAPHVTGARLKGGGTRAAFAPDGSLWIACTAGWGAGEDGLQRVRWDGRAGLEILDIKLAPRGLRLSFTRPLPVAELARTAAYEVNRFRYYYQSKYGSPPVDEARVAVTAARPAPDGSSVELEFGELAAGFIHEVSVPTLQAADGERIANPLGYYTVNALPDGTRPVGGTTRLPRPGETAMTARDAANKGTSREALFAAGEKIYRAYCVGCHQPDGRGVPGGAANFVDDRTRLAKEDAALLAILEHGNEAKGMPAFGAILSPIQRRAA
ncbi:MAG: c-type cytochrome, partial [Opitutaceae bacterium]